ncbi:MAG: hypothetical protein Q9183_005760, partial [Haloplaca sp. 2 TL-2023]
MASLTIASKANQAITLPPLLLASYVNESNPNAKVNIAFEDVEKLQQEDASFALTKASSGPSDPIIKDLTQVLIHTFKALKGKDDDLIKEWARRADSLAPTDFKSVEGPLLELDSHLTLRSYVVGYSLTPADLVVWGAIRGNKVAYAAIKKGAMVNVTRWFKFIEETNP